MNLIKQNRDKSIILILIVLIIIIYLPITLVQIYVHNNNDYGGHILEAQILQGGFDKIIPTNQSHPLYQVIILAVHEISGFDFKVTAVILALLVEILLGLELFRLINASITYYKAGHLFKWVIPLVVCLMIAAPIPLMVFVDLHLYFGYLGIANYHNPTIILLKPLAVLSLIYGVKAFEATKHNIIVIIVSAVLMALSTLDKPNLTICILPALAIMAGINFFNKEPFDWILLLFGFFIPAVLLLAWEYQLAFTPGGGGIRIEPFSAMRLLSDHVITKFVISILFPAGVAVIYLKKIIKDKRMTLTWLIFFFGAFYTYFLIEGGARRADGNFGWSGEIAMFLLFIFSTIFFLEKKLESPKFSFPDLFLVGIFALYILSGVIYYIYCMNVNHISYLPKGIIAPLHIKLFEYKIGLF